MFFPWVLVLLVRRLCGGGLAVDKIKFWIFCLVTALIVQHVQIEITKNHERDNWRRICVQLQADKAHAVLPVALAAAAPHVLAALVAGTTAIWCYMHGGKEAIIQFTGAVHDGAAVTADWIKQKIAEANGVNTSPTPAEDYDPSDSLVTLNGVTYTLGTNVGCNYGQVGNPAFKIIDGPNGGIMIMNRWEAGYAKYCYYKWDGGTVQNPSLPGFDPADYPQFYTGPALLSNCHEVAKQYPSLSLVYPPPSGSRPSVYDPTKTIEIPIAAQLADGSLIDQKGRKLPPPPPGVVPGLINPPTLDPDLVGGAQIETPAPDTPSYVDTTTSPVSDVVLPKDLSDKIGALGITGPITGIKDIGGTKHITWTNAQGKSIATPVAPAIAQQLAPHLPASVVQSGSGSVTDSGETDPGNPADVDLPTVPTFDTDWAWGDMLEWDWSAWIQKIPFLSVLSGASIQLSGATSVIQFPITVYDQSRIVSFDFADYDMIWQAMGLIIYAVACWWALQLALLKNG